MDWTGGAGRRFAPGKNNAMLQKQKAHFAKARAAQQNPRSSSRSFKPSFLRDLPHVDASSRQREAATGDERFRSPHAASHVKLPRIGQDMPEGEDETGRPHRHTLQQRSLSAIYISSRSGSSSVVSSASHHVSRDVKPQTRQPSVHRQGMNDEERLLLAKRRKLLARTDWLGLNTLRPINMRFPSSRDKDHIGKRRKIKSSASRKGRPAAQRAITPPFRRPISPRDHIMSGALQPDDIRIKIGTDALVSQTQPSRRSHTPGKTSIRHSSTEFGALSEEEMLLGPDEDAFQSELLNGPTTGLTNVNVSDDRSMVAIAGSQMVHGAHIIPETADMGPIYGGREAIPLYEYDQHAPQHTNTRGPFEAAPRSEFTYVTYEAPQLPLSQHEPMDRWVHQSASEPTTGQRVQNSINQPMPTTQSADDEQRWTQLFDIAQPSSTRHSIAALKSSSMHVATSESDSRQQKALRSTMHPNHITGMISFPEKSPVSPAIAHAQATGVNETIGSAPANLQSPSASLQRITKLAEQAAVKSRQAQQDAEDEAFWKQFIIGSQDSSKEATPARDATHNYDEMEDIELTQVSSAFTVSGLGTSVKSTAGDTLFVNTDTSSRVSEESSKSKRKRKRTLTLTTINQVASDVHTRRPQRPIHDQNTEADDDIEDVDLPPKRTMQANIHVGTTNILNHKQFKPSARKSTPQTSNPNRFSAPRRSKTFTHAGHSVYDLVDSDGVSLP